MFPYPLHPAIVHFPIALFILAPIVALGSLWAIRKGARPVRAWGLTLAVLGALFITTWLAVETGENDEDVVERVVPRGAVHEHEEIAETFLLLTGVVLVVSAAGLAWASSKRASNMASSSARARSFGSDGRVSRKLRTRTVVTASCVP